MQSDNRSHAKILMIGIMIFLGQVIGGPPFDISNPKELFLQYQKDYQMHFSTPQEHAFRFEIFMKNLKMIKQLNEENTATFGITRFTAMTDDERKQHCCGGNLIDMKIEGEHVAPQLPKRLASIPKNFDWSDHGAVTPIKFQGSCGACWAFAAVGSIEGVWVASGHNLTDFSEQEFTDCATSNMGCAGGWPWKAYRDIIKLQNGTINTESSYPYNFTQHKMCSANKSTPTARLVGYNAYCNISTTPCNEDDMAQWLYQQGPLAICFNALLIQSYKGGIFSGVSHDVCPESMTDHCVTLVGYGVDSETGMAFWRIKNQWGSDWGENGYGRLQRGVGICGINGMVASPILEAV